MGFPGHIVDGRPDHNRSQDPKQSKWTWPTVQSSNGDQLNMLYGMQSNLVSLEWKVRQHIIIGKLCKMLAQKWYHKWLGFSPLLSMRAAWVRSTPAHMSRTMILHLWCHPQRHSSAVRWCYGILYLRPHPTQLGCCGLCILSAYYDQYNQLTERLDPLTISRSLVWPPRHSMLVVSDLVSSAVIPPS